MDLALKQRLVGAIVLIALAVIFLPMLLDGSGQPESHTVGVEIPERVEAPASQFDAPDVESELSAGEPEPAIDSEAAGEPAASGWVVQVGSFAREANAVVLRDRLRDEGFAAFVSEGVADGEPVWRVRVGPLAEESEARQIAREIRSGTDRPALVMSYP